MSDADQVVAEIVAAATRPKAGPSKADFDALVASIDSEPERYIQLDRIVAELAPMLARFDALHRDGLADLVLKKWKWVKKGVLQEEIGKVVKALKPRTTDPDTDDRFGEPYIVRDHRTMRLGGRDAMRYVELANFEAHIIRQVEVDTGVDVTCHLVLEGRMCDGQPLREVRVPAADWGSLRWVSKLWGGAPAISPENGAERHLRRAIQHLSGTSIPTESVRAFTGWFLRDGERIYLHGGGAITAAGADPSVRVELAPNLKDYSLPEPPIGADLVAAIRMSIGTLGIAPLAVTAPLFAATWRSVVPMLTDYLLLVAGKSTSGKSEVAARFQQHFGPGFSRLKLPGNWSSTINSLEADAFAIQHALFTIDDLVTSGSRDELKETEKAFDRLVRSIGNHCGRGRQNADGTARVARPPRGLVVITAEDLPPARQSAIVRLLKLEVGESDVNWEKLRTIRAAGDAGVLASAMSGFLAWLAPRIDRVLDTFGQERDGYITWAQKLGPMMRRTPQTTADLLVGLRLFMDFAEASGALEPQQAAAVFDACKVAIADVAQDQGHVQSARDPVNRFLSVLRSAILTERAHIAAVAGGAPGPQLAGLWGWRLRDSGAGNFRTQEWQPCGVRVGWMDPEKDSLYLDQETSYAQVQDLARKSGEGLPIGFRRLGRALYEAGKLKETEIERRTYTARKTVSGKSMGVLVLSLKALDELDGSDKDKPDPGVGSIGSSGNSTDLLLPTGETQTIQDFISSLVAVGSIGSNGKDTHMCARDKDPHVTQCVTQCVMRHDVIASCGGCPISGENPTFATNGTEGSETVEESPDTKNSQQAPEVDDFIEETPIGAIGSKVVANGSGEPRGALWAHPGTPPEDDLP